MSETDLATLLHAAELLEDEARGLRKGSTFSGRWERNEYGRAAKRDHDDMIATARRLREMAG